MWILGFIVLGALIAWFLFPPAGLKWVSPALTAVTAVLIFTLGLSLGADESFFSNLASLGVKSVVFALVPMGFSIGAVWLVQRFFLSGGKKDKGGRE